MLAREATPVALGGLFAIWGHKTTCWPECSKNLFVEISLWMFA